MNPRLLIFILLFPLLFFGCLSADAYSVDSEGRVHYPSQRGSVKFSESLVNDTAAYLLQKVFLEVGDGQVAALVWSPKASGRHPAVLFHPGAGVTKEAGKAYAELLVPQGFVVLSVDARGLGETTAPAASQEEDFQRFQEKKEPFEHRRIFDFLRAFDYLQQRTDINTSNILFAGESFGGRIAIVAAAIEPQARAVVGISTSGFGLPQGRDVDSTRFLRSMDPENYVALLPPRKLVVMHSKSDSVVPFSSAQSLYAKAKEPKEFVEVPCANHGYCPEMNPDLERVFLSLAN